MRIVALFFLVVPGIVATYGVKLMRDSLFGVVAPIFFNSWIQFIAGIIFFIGGLAFIGGFILHRDKKRNLTKGRFKRR